MTNQEYIAATTQRFNFSESDIALFWVNQPTLDPEAEADATACKTALVKEIANIIPLYNVSEGGFSISWNYEAIKMWYNATCAELGIVPTATKPTLKHVDVW